MIFFEGKETSLYFEVQHRKLREEVEKISDTDIVSCDFNEWTEYLCSKYEIMPVTFFKENIEQSLTEKKVRKYNHFYRELPYEKQYYEVDGVSIAFKIPFDGESELFQLQPSRRILARFEAKELRAPYGDNCGTLVLEFEYSKQELQDKADKMQEYVKKDFEQEFRYIKTMIGYVNSEVSSYNTRLATFSNQCLKERKQKAESLSYISQMLEIPLYKSKSAPNATPVPLTRVTRVPVQKPNAKPLPNEYAINDRDYENINNIILMCGTAMEKTARTYYRNTEEELRDHLLATLNTHYENASGETFRKIGKTDINIEFENKAAYVGECKIWHGEKMFSEAIQQVLNYSTWKDIKISVIIFNKENQSFHGIVNKIDEWVKVNAKSSAKKKLNLWDCKYYRANMNVEIRLNILAFDLYVDSTQFQDSKR